MLFAYIFSKHPSYFVNKGSDKTSGRSRSGRWLEKRVEGTSRRLPGLGYTVFNLNVLEAKAIS